jgi:peroxiredoxin
LATVTFNQDTVCNLGGNEIYCGDMAGEVRVVICINLIIFVVVGGALENVHLVVVVPSLDSGVCVDVNRSLYVVVNRCYG